VVVVLFPLRLFSSRFPQSRRNPRKRKRVRGYARQTADWRARHGSKAKAKASARAKASREGEGESWRRARRRVAHWTRTGGFSREARFECDAIRNCCCCCCCCRRNTKQDQLISYCSHSANSNCLCWHLTSQSGNSVTVLSGLSFLGWSQAFLSRDLPQICPNGDKLEAYRPRSETVFWWLEAVLEATWRMLLFFLLGLSTVQFWSLITFMLSWTVRFA